jgi:PST family polysaccharide transporter
MGTVVALRLLGFVAAIPLALLAVSMLRPADGQLLAVTAILATGAVLRSFDAVDYFLQAELRARHSATVRLTAAIATCTVSLLLIALRAPLVAFAAALVVEFAVSAVVFCLTYRRLGSSPLRWRFSSARARYILATVWPAFIGGAATMVYFRIDQIMLGSMATPQEVGLYASAARLSELWYFLPTAIATSVFPALILLRESDQAAYERRLRRLYTLLAWLGIGLALATTFTAEFVVAILFGPSYEPAGRMLAVHIWACPFIFMGALLGRWLVNESLFGLAAVRHSWGAGLNVGLNLLLIPEFGGMGAAAATLVSYAFVNYFACFTSGRMRAQGVMMTQSLLAPLSNVKDFLPRRSRSDALRPEKSTGVEIE